MEGEHIVTRAELEKLSKDELIEMLVEHQINNPPDNWIVFKVKDTGGPLGFRISTTLKGEQLATYGQGTTDALNKAMRLVERHFPLMAVWDAGYYEELDAWFIDSDGLLTVRVSFI